jgi:hypothetical protein
MSDAPTDDVELVAPALATLAPGTEAHERLARAMTGVLASFASSAAFAARLTPNRERAFAYEHLSHGFDDRRQAMAEFAAALEKRPRPTPAEPAPPPKATHSAAVTVALPGLKQDLGLGDAITKFTSMLGIKACGGCARRAAALNRALMFRRSGGEK